MGLLDTLRDRLIGSDDDYYDDDYYDDDEYEDEEEPEEQVSGILGNTRRPEADSVSVYTRSGRPVESTQTERSYVPERRSYADDEQSDARYSDSRYDSYGATEQRAATRVPSGQLPPYVLRPEAYDDVQSVVRRVRTNQPVVLVFRNTNIDTAKRILDFCFGLSFGINGSVEELGDRTFVVLPAGMSLSSADIDKLVADGAISR